MTICRKCNEDGGDGLYCNSCGARFDKSQKCPKCDAAIGPAAKFCPACGSPLETKGAPGPPGPPGAGYRAGDIGIFRGSIDSSSHTATTSLGGASAGNIIIGLPPQTGPAGPPQTICPICGEYPDLRASFRCLRCNRDFVCLRHRDVESNWCNQCAASERPRRGSQEPGSGASGDDVTVGKRRERGSTEAELEHKRADETQRRVEEARERAEGSQRSSGSEVRSCEGGESREPAMPGHVTARLVGDGVVWTSMKGSELESIVCEVLRSFGATDVSADPQTHSVSGKTGFNWKSTGQIISATIRQLPDGSSISVASKPKPPQLIDGGRGASDVQQITDLLAQRLNSRP